MKLFETSARFEPQKNARMPRGEHPVKKFSMPLANSQNKNPSKVSIAASVNATPATRIVGLSDPSPHKMRLRL